MKTLTEKYRGVLNETFNKTQFVRDARMAMPNLLSQFNGFEDTVSILKNKGLISEKAEDKALKHHNLSDEAIRRGADIEIEEMGRMSQDSVSVEDQAKAKDKALANLIKDPLHYLNIMAGESTKVDKHDKPVEYAKGKEVDKENGMKKVELKENYTKDTLIKALGSADDAFIQLVDGRELIIYNPNSNNDDNAAMWHDDIVFAVDKDGQEEEVDYRDISNAYLGGEMSEAEPIPTSPGRMERGEDGKMYNVVMSNANRKMAMRKVIDALTIVGDEKGFKVNTDQALEFIRTHKDDIFSGDIDVQDIEDIWSNYNEYDTINRDSIDNMQEIEIDEEDVDEAMTDQDMKDIEKYGQKDNIVKPYKPGQMFSSDFDYEGMLEAGLKVRLNTPIDTLIDIFDSFTDVNYHSEASHLSYAIESIEEKDKVEALDHLRNFRKAIKQTLLGFNEGVDPSRKQNEGKRSKTYGKLAEGRRKKATGGKVVTENDYETGGYVESMGPKLDKGVNFLIEAWEEWKMGPMTEPGMIEHAKKDLLSYLETQFIVENLEEEKGKDHDGDGDVDADDYMAGKDKAIKKALNKDEQLVKENLKSIIAKVLEEGTINEAATNKLADWGSSYETFPGVKPVVNSLENIVTEIEQFYDKIGDKIADTFSKTADFKNEEGLNIGAFIAPSLESAFKQDLRPVLKGGFIKKVELPKVKTISRAEIDRPNMGTPDIAEEEAKQTVYSAPFNGTLRETKKKR